MGQGTVNEMKALQITMEGHFWGETCTVCPLDGGSLRA